MPANMHLDDQEQGFAMKLFRGLLAVLLIGAGVVGVGRLISSRGEEKRAGGRSINADARVPVIAAEAHVADVPVNLVSVGTVRALNLVTVRTQVSGALIRVAFREGQDVKKGDVLAEIDPTIYKAQLDQQTAKKALDEALLANSKVDLERYANLLKTNAVTKQQYDTQKAIIDQQEAQLRVDQGLIDNQRAYMNWCAITSPIDGRTGIRQVDQGNIVSTADTNGIVVVTQLQPVTVLFNLPQQQLSRVNKAFAKGPLSIQATEADNHTVVDTGTLQVVNNQVDQSTGTVQYKAEFPNKELQLWPGQFVNIQLLVDTLRQVVVVPTAAVQRGPNGAFVYVVQPDGTIKLMNVTVTQQDDTEAVIAGGVVAADRVVTSGFGQIVNGRKVIVSSGSAPRGQRAQNPQGLQSPLGRSEQQIQLGGGVAEGSRRYDRRGSEGTRNETQNATP
jgi:multidrug efflux system membrane fusion protein